MTHAGKGYRNINCHASTRLGRGVDGQQWDGEHATGRRDVENCTFCSAMRNVTFILIVYMFKHFFNPTGRKNNSQSTPLQL